MFVDASAIVAILAREDDAASLAARLGKAETIHTSAVAIYEAVLGLARIGAISLTDASDIVQDFLVEVDARTIPITEDIAARAITAFERYGKGRHAAALNMGDCFAYACVESLGVALLFKGDDFPLTDIAVA